MANEITIQYTLPERPPESVLNFRESPPAWLVDWKFELVDETYNGLVYRGTNSSTRFGRMFAGGTYTLSFLFVADERFGTRMTITGQAPEKMAALIRADAEAHGGGIDPRVQSGPSIPGR